MFTKVARFLTLSLLLSLISPVTIVTPAFATSPSITVGGGASTVANLVNFCSPSFSTATTSLVNYTASPSGIALANINSDIGDINFLESYTVGITNPKAIRVPITSTAILVFVNLPGIPSLNFTIPTLARIYSGAISNWSDAEISAENPGSALPNQPIMRIFRSDSAVATYNITSAFSALAPTVWPVTTSTFSSAMTSIISADPTHFQSAAGDGGVVSLMHATPYSITYSQSSYLGFPGLIPSRIANASGAFIYPNSVSVGSFLNDSLIDPLTANIAFNYKTSDPNAYLLANLTYAVADSGLSSDQADVVGKYLQYLLSSACITQADPGSYFKIYGQLERTAESQIVAIDPPLAGTQLRTPVIDSPTQTGDGAYFHLINYSSAFLPTTYTSNGYGSVFRVAYDPISVERAVVSGLVPGDKSIALITYSQFGYFDSDTFTSVTVSPVSSHTYLLGYQGPLTGTDAAVGNDQIRAMKFAISQFEALHPGTQVNILPIDDQGNPAVASAVSLGVAQNSQILGIVGPAYSGAAIASFPAYKAAGIPLVSPSAIRSTITTPSSPQYGGPIFFRVAPPGTITNPPPTVGAVGSAAAALVMESTTASSLSTGVVLASNGDPYFGGAIESETASVLNQSGVLTYKFTIPAMQTSYIDSATAIIATGAKTVIFAGYYPESAYFAKSLKLAGYTGTIIDSSGSITSDYINIVGSTNSEGILSLNSDPALAEVNFPLAAAYVKDVGLAWGSFAVATIDATNTFLAGIAAGVSSRSEMLAWVRDYRGIGVAGNPINFTSDGDLAIPYWALMQAHSGTFYQIGHTPMSSITGNYLVSQGNNFLDQGNSLVDQANALLDQQSVSPAPNFSTEVDLHNRATSLLAAINLLSKKRDFLLFSIDYGMQGLKDGLTKDCLLAATDAATLLQDVIQAALIPTNLVIAQSQSKIAIGNVTTLASLRINGTSALGVDTIELPSSTSVVIVTYTKSQAEQVIRVTGATDLKTGDNPLTITVTAADGMTQATYSVNLHVAAPTQVISGAGGGGTAPAPVVSSTSTPSATPMASSTPSPSSSPTPTSSATPTPSATPVLSLTPTPTPTPTLTANPTPTPNSTGATTKGSSKTSPSPQSSENSASSSKTPVMQPIISAPTTSQLKTLASIRELSIPAKNAPVANIPISVSTSSSVVTSTAVGKAISIALPKVPSGTKITYSLVQPGNKLVIISSASTKTSASGNLPPISFKTPGTYTLMVTVGKVTKKITVTVKK